MEKIFTTPDSDAQMPPGALAQFTRSFGPDISLINGEGNMDTSRLLRDGVQVDTMAGATGLRISNVIF